MNQFLRGPLAAMPAMRDAAGSVAAHARTMTGLYADGADCMTSYLLYDLGQICLTWALDADGHVDRFRVEEILDSYRLSRSLTAREYRHAEDFIAAWTAATGIGLLSSKLRQGGTVTGPRDSIALSVFLQLRA